MSTPGRRLPRPGPPVDVGLQAERTRLAWTRTALTFVANGGLLMHVGNAEGSWPWVLPGVGVVACGLVVYGLGVVRQQRTDVALRGGLPAAGGPIIAVAAAMAVLASLAGLVLSVGDP